MPYQKRHFSNVADDRCLAVAFPSQLGWMAIAGHDGDLCQLTFGHSTKATALKALGGRVHGPVRGLRRLCGCCRLSLRESSDAFAERKATVADGVVWNRSLVERLQAYAAGGCDDFRDVRVDLGELTAFQRRVLECCRRIPYATTVSYTQLAATAGSPHASRAVGNCMAGNRLPLIIPCHRVVASDGRLGGFSAPGGLYTKRRLLELEQGN
jgi:methylated-DNA-[protein]-cysteine S-methyltransferase